MTNIDGSNKMIVLFICLFSHSKQDEKKPRTNDEGIFRFAKFYNTSNYNDKSKKTNGWQQQWSMINEKKLIYSVRIKLENNFLKKIGSFSNNNIIVSVTWKLPESFDENDKKTALLLLWGDSTMKNFVCHLFYF